MITVFTAWRHRWHQRALDGAAIALGKRQLWGFHEETLQQIALPLRTFLTDQYTAAELRSVRGHLETPNIDTLIADLMAAGVSMEMNPRGERGVVLERLNYTNPQLRTLYSYLATSNGKALGAADAFAMFDRTAQGLAHELDTMFNEEDANTDQFYFTSRYGNLWQETLAVYALFARLAGFTLPPFA